MSQFEGPEFLATTHRYDDQTVVLLSGEVDLDNTKRLETVLDEAIARNQRVVLDLSGVTFIDSSGLSELLTARQKLLELNGSFVIRSPQAPVRLAIQAAGLDGILEVE